MWCILSSLPSTTTSPSPFRSSLSKHDVWYNIISPDVLWFSI
jgi:hypothetical protein